MRKRSPSGPKERANFASGALEEVGSWERKKKRFASLVGERGAAGKNGRERNCSHGKKKNQPLSRTRALAKCRKGGEPRIERVSPSISKV